MRNLKISLLTVSISALLAGCQAGENQTNIELIQDMMDQRSLKSQDYDTIRDEPSFRNPPAGTVPRGFKPYKYANNIAGAEANLLMPASLPKSEAFQKRGQEKFNIYCGVCHGLEGRGDGSIAQYMSVKPPSLVSDKVKGYRDGRIFHVITEGYGVMSSYATQVRSEEDRWAIVNYMRKLQGR